MLHSFVKLLAYNTVLLYSVSCYLIASCSAEVLDKHLSMVQMDYEQKSQIVERRIRDESELPGVFDL